MKKLFGRSVTAILLLPLALILRYLCGLNPVLTEAIYSRKIYPVLAAIISPVFRLFPFPAAELLVILLAAGLLFGILRGLFHPIKTGLKGLLRGIVRLAAFACAVFFLFEALWGLNYYRQPLSVNLGYKTQTPSKEELTAIMTEQIDALNSLCPQITYGKNGLSTYGGSFKSMSGQADDGFGRLSAEEPPRNRLIAHVTTTPKSIFPSALMSRIGIEGIFVPFTYEAIVDSGYPDCVLPFDISHETAHFKGFAREDEANFMAYLACMNNSDLYYQYSGHLDALMYLSNALYTTDQAVWKQTVSRLDKRVAADIDGYYSYVQKQRTGFEKTAEKVNDSYLKSQGQAGVVTYDMFVNLLAGKYRSEHKSAA